MEVGLRKVERELANAGSVRKQKDCNGIFGTRIAASDGDCKGSRMTALRPCLEKLLETGVMLFGVIVEWNVCPEFTGAVCDAAPATADLRDRQETGQRRQRPGNSVIPKLYEYLDEKLEWNERGRSARLT